MKKANPSSTKVEEPKIRLTRARAKALGTLGELLPASRPNFKQDHRRIPRANSKRLASDENNASTTTASTHHKRRAVLKDVTNVFNDNSSRKNKKETKIQTSRKSRRGPVRKNSEAAFDVSMQIPLAHGDANAKFVEDISKIRMAESQEAASPRNSRQHKQLQQRTRPGVSEQSNTDAMLTSENVAALQRPQKIEDNDINRTRDTFARGIVDIDSKFKDPLLCSLYARDIYNNIRTAELQHRPLTSYMQKVQRDINPSMRGILIDWLVEVSEEYKLVPDTLYLTVNLIDRFLSQNSIEKQRLQLLGVTCMLISSKYEEICAPRVEEFCIITDNTYTKEEVVKMETQVLNFLNFQLSVPTTKTFLRRFIQAAQASYNVPCVELEFLANYLAELTLVEYSFLKYLPSLVAASAIFLARWTLNQSDHPWNPTLEHYTNYVASELKTAVLRLEALQLNTSGCCLNAIREKYRQQKFKCVAALASSKPALSLF